MKRRTVTPVVDRVFRRVVETPSGCWEWTGATAGGGYGTIKLGRLGQGVAPTHRVVYEYLVGPIPDGLVIDHLCRNRRCCNPNHLDPVPQSLNIRRGERWSSRPDSCKHGHQYTEENTLLTREGYRICRTCHRANGRRSYQRRKAS